MTSEHALLAGIRAGIDGIGWHAHCWGELRREVFPGPASWTALKAWCAENGLECELAFGQSSKATLVEFRKVRKAVPAAASAAVVAASV